MDYFRELEYEYIRDPSIATDSKSPERADYGEVVLARRTARHSAPQVHLWRTAKAYGAIFEGQGL